MGSGDKSCKNIADVDAHVISAEIHASHMLESPLLAASSARPSFLTGPQIRDDHGW
jgi:hypothetical protein